jgi:hypothetical protein
MNYERSNWHIRRKQAERQSGDVGYCPERTAPTTRRNGRDVPAAENQTGRLLP